jgi:hypothetical protein
MITTLFAQHYGNRKPFADGTGAPLEYILQVKDDSSNNREDDSTVNQVYHFHFPSDSPRCSGKVVIVQARRVNICILFLKTKKCHLLNNIFFGFLFFSKHTFHVTPLRKEVCVCNVPWQKRSESHSDHAPTRTRTHDGNALGLPNTTKFLGMAQPRGKIRKTRKTRKSPRKYMEKRSILLIVGHEPHA